MCVINKKMIEINYQIVKKRVLKIKKTIFK